MKRLRSALAGVIGLWAGVLFGETPQIDTNAVPAAPELEQRELEAWLDGVIPYGIERGDIAGAVVIVVKDGEVLLQKGYGYADVEKRRPMDPQQTVLGVGSVSKLFTWTAAMQQVEQGKLDLDRDISSYLDIEMPATFDEPITLRHLMTHSAGFEERAFRLAPDGEQARALREYIQQVPPPDRIYPAGEVLAYSNYGSMLAGYLVERVSGERFVDYVQKHILDPLDMRQSSFQRPPPPHLQADLSRSYGTASGQPKQYENEEPAGDPSGHLVTTAADISHFMLAHLQEGRYGDRQLLQPDTARLMHAPSYTPIPGGRSLALGFFRMDYNGRPILAHMGDISGFHADLELLPTERVGFFMAINSDGTPMGALSSGHALRQQLFRRFMDRYYPPLTATAEEPTLETAREHARLAAGQYRMTRRHSGDFMEAVSLVAGYFAAPVNLTANADGTITTPGWLSFEHGRPRTWREVAPFKWREVGGSAHLDMKLQDGRVVGFFPDDVLTTWTNERVPTIWSAHLNVPVLLAACIVLVLSALMWPVVALTRRHFGRHDGRVTILAAADARAARLTHIAAVVATVYLLGWFALVAASVPSQLSSGPWIRIMQLIGLLCVPGAAVAVWNTWLAWHRRESVWVRLSSALVALALIELVWFSFAFHLISVRVNY